MRYLLYNGNSLNTILFILSRYGYTLNYPKVSISSVQMMTTLSLKS